MALINCPQCSKLISSAADSCVHCGYLAPSSQPLGYEIAPNHQDYQAVATAASPFLAIYLIDVSGSMTTQLAGSGGKSKINLVQEAFNNILNEMMARSLKGEIVSPRYGINVLAYSDTVQDVYGGTISITEAMNRPIPEFRTGNWTNTLAAFQRAKEILQQRLPQLANAPAPMVCHLTDGAFTDGCDPSRVIQEIQQMRNKDGHVLVENIYVGDRLTNTPIHDVHQWPGVQSPSELSYDYLNSLYHMSSALPASYAQTLQHYGFNMQPGVKMLIPAVNADLVELAFTMSGGTVTM
ncbi:MAG: hypothetical protein JWL77_4870 [Chthonomonadaceae bacterium]|nr:hypothetical protein [Chthonomonadaceae bacterium]